MKSVLLSIQPKWCKLIASGKKSVAHADEGIKICVKIEDYLKGRAYKMTKSEVNKDGHRV